MSLSKEANVKPWGVAEFGLYRPQIKEFVDENIAKLIDTVEYDIRRILIHGEVKSGKREIVEYIACRDSNSIQREHVFISSFHRVADDCQREELKMHNLSVYSIINDSYVQDANRHINNRLNLGKKLILHFDECDFGSGFRQNLKKIYSRFKNNKNVIFILYSATPEELLFSLDITQSEEDESFIDEFYEEGIRLYYIPPEGYCGAKMFIENGLVEEADPFIEICENGVKLSEQARKIISDSKQYIEESVNEKLEANYLYRKYIREGNIVESEKYKKICESKIRNIITLRFTGKTESYRSIELFARNLHLFEELQDVYIIFDKCDYDEKKNVLHKNATFEQVDWSKRAYWDLKNDNVLIIVVNELTSTRSTEWDFHDRVYCTHDYRNSICYSTVAQAQLRVAHYRQKYGSFQKIKVYGHLKTFLFAAKLIDVTEYLIHDWTKEEFKRDKYEIGETVSYKDNKKWYQAEIIEYDNVNDLYHVRFNDGLKTWIVENVGVKDIKFPEKMYKIVSSKNSQQLHYEYNSEYTSSDADNILEKIGCAKKINLSTRIKGKCKLVNKIESDFIECNPENVVEKLELIKHRTDLPDDVTEHDFMTSHLFVNYDIINGEKIYKGTLRSHKQQYSYDFIKQQRWGFSQTNRKPRITVCYDDDRLGLCLRYLSHEKEEINSLSSYLSMYQSLK
jgi:hypothetical protein